MSFDSTRDYQSLCFMLIIAGWSLYWWSIMVDAGGWWFIMPAILFTVGLVGAIFIPATCLCVHHIADAIREGYEEDKK